MYIADLALTLYGLKAGLLVEENPLVRMLLNHSLAAAIIFKLGLLAVFVVAASLLQGEPMSCSLGNRSSTGCLRRYCTVACC